MHGLIESAVSAVSGDPLHVSFRVTSSSASGSATTGGPSAPSPVSATTELPAATTAAHPAPQRLNSRYTFDAFVVGPSNQLAFAASMAVAEAPGLAYNPLFLYGSSGLGKTHLLHAIGLRAQAAGRSVRYVTCEEFTNDYLSAIRERRTDAFRARYRATDLLLVDDVQFLSGKEGTQEGFFHTFNALHDSGRQVVLSSDRSPSALPLLDERLRSRFDWGLSADITPPEAETRLAILQRHAAAAPVDVPDAVLELIAMRATSNIRQLEGSLNRLTALAYFTGQPATEDLALRCLGSTIAATQPTSSPKTAIAVVAAYFGIPPAALVSGKRDKATVYARQIAMHLLNSVFNLAPQDVGLVLGGRDRTTVIYSLKKVTSSLSTNATLKADVEQLTSSLRDSTLPDS
jgi:chromosomal replication initiator protein